MSGKLENRFHNDACLLTEDEVTVVVQNPSYSVLPSSTTLSTPQYHKVSLRLLPTSYHRLSL